MSNNYILVNKYSIASSFEHILHTILINLNYLFIYNFNYPFKKIFGYFFISKEHYSTSGKNLIFPYLNNFILNGDSYIIKTSNFKLHIKILFNFISNFRF